MTEIQFVLHREHIALHQLLKLTGLCASGGQAKQVIDAGQVEVDGKIETRKACKIRAKQMVQMADIRLHVEAA